MNIFKRILCFVLVLSFIGIALVGCGNNGSGDGLSTADQISENISGATETETNIYGEPSFTTSIEYDELNFEGEQLTVLLRMDEVTVREWYKESPEDELDEAVAMRNAAVIDALNVEIDFEIIPFADYHAYFDNFNNMIIDDVINGFHYYDIAVHWALAGGYANVRDCNANVLDDTQFPYFDFSLPCWNQSVVNGTVVNGRLHLFCGDINISQFDFANVFWYNKTLYDIKKESTDHDDIQDLALDGQWTYAELYRWATRLYEDSNGTPGKQLDDTLAYATHWSVGNPVPGDALAAVFDVDILTTNPDGTHSYNIIGNEKAAKVRDMWIKLFETSGSWDQGAPAKYFAAGKYLFWSSMLYPSRDDNMVIREMEDKYGLLPMPKYDENQEQYYTASYDGYSLMSVIDHANSSVPTKGDAISAFLQLSTEESYTSVRGYYFNRVVKPKYFGTDNSDGTVTKSVTLFDTIINNITFEFWTIYSNQLGDLTWAWRDSLEANKNSLEVTYTSRQNEFDDALKDMDEWFGLVSFE